MYLPEITEDRVSSAPLKAYRKIMWSDQCLKCSAFFFCGDRIKTCGEFHLILRSQAAVGSLILVVHRQKSSDLLLSRDPASMETKDA